MPTKWDAVKVLYFVIPVASCIALILGAISWSRTTTLALPLPEWVPATTTLLSPLTFLGLIGFRMVLQRRENSNSWWRRTFPILDHLHSALSTVLATVALAYLFPENTLSCHLDQQWQAFFQSKDSRSIRTIQDRFQCCGLRSIHDRAWPFKDKTHGDNACELQLGYQQSCVDPWREQQQRVSWMVFVAAVATFAVKIAAVHFFSTRRTWMDSRWAGIPDHQRIADTEARQNEEEDEVNQHDRSTLLPQANTAYHNQWDVD